MKLMRLAMVVAVFALVGGKAIAEDSWANYGELHAKLAAQEARLNDLHAKMYGSDCEGPAAPEGITSLRKNAVVTIGGFTNTRLYAGKGSLKSTLTANDGTINKPVTAGRETVESFSGSKIQMGDAVLQVKIDVNEYFDAFAQFNFLDHNRGGTGPAQNYWFRWKNVCNSGFGLLMGRDSLKFGGIQSYGFWDSYGNGWEDSSATFGASQGMAALLGPNGFGEGMFWLGDEASFTPAHTIWNNSRTMQITPYWESQDGKFKAELSWFQTTEESYAGAYTEYARRDGRSYRGKTINNFGSFSARVTAKPIEGLTIMASVMDQMANNGDGWWSGVRSHTYLTAAQLAGMANVKTSNHNIATNVGFEYRPCFLNRLNVFASWTHGWNENWVKDQDSDSINFGLGVDLTDQLTWYATGDWLRVKNDNAQVWHKANMWAVETGFTYTLPYGVNFQLAYRHDDYKFKNRAGATHTKYKTDSFVLHTGFNF